MNTRLLKINAMKRFTRWLDTNYVHLSLFRVYVHMPLSKTYIGLEKREERARQRDKFWKARCKIRPKFSNEPFVSARIAHGVKATDLLGYIIKRASRRNNMTLKEYRKKLLELELKPITNSKDLEKFNNDRNKLLCEFKRKQR